MNIEEKAIEVLKHCKGRRFSAFDKIYFDDETNMCIYQAIETLLTAYEKEKEKNKLWNMRINNLISQIENAIDFMKTDKTKIKVDMYQQKEEDLKLEIVHLKKLLKEE